MHTELDYDIPIEALHAICQPGPNDCAVDEWYGQLGIAKMLTRKSAQYICDEAGCTKYPAEPLIDLKKRAFWLSAWSQYEMRDDV